MLHMTKKMNPNSLQWGRSMDEVLEMNFLSEEGRKNTGKENLAINWIRSAEDMARFTVTEDL